jgi:hypothetical protein
MFRYKYVAGGTLFVALAFLFAGCDKRVNGSSPVVVPTITQVAQSSFVDSTETLSSVSNATKIAPMSPDDVASQVAAEIECPAPSPENKIRSVRKKYNHFRLVYPCPETENPDGYIWEYHLGGDATVTGTVWYGDTQYNEQLIFDVDEKDQNLVDGIPSFKFGNQYPIHKINIGVGDLFNLPTLGGGGRNCWVARATVRVHMITVDREENSLAGNYLTEFSVPNVGEFKPCEVNATPQTPANAHEAFVVRDGVVKIHKEASERSAAKGLYVRADDLIWIYETRSNWTFIRYVGTKTSTLPKESEIFGGWVLENQLKEMVR